MIHAKSGDDREGTVFSGCGETRFRIRIWNSYQGIGFVSGYRFSDTVSSSVSDAPLGAAVRQILFGRAVSLGQGFGFSR
jgi:hypothetical protein